MSVPWRFLVALVAGFALGIVAFVGALCSQLGVATESSHWTYALLHRKQELAAQMTGPRLLILSGSAGLFGINAQLIQQQTGYPTMNMAVHVGLGLDYQLYYIRETARAGDTVFLPLEYALYSTSYDNEAHDDFVLARDPGYFHQLPWPETISMATRIRFVRLQIGWRDKRHPEKTRAHQPYEDTIDNNGDYLNNMAVDRQPNSPLMLLKAEELLDWNAGNHSGAFAKLRDFIAWAKTHQVRVLAGFPNLIARPEYDGPAAEQAIQAITDFYKSEGVPVIGNAREVMLPPEQFFNMSYHPTHEAALERTKRLIPELEPYLQKGA